MKKLMTSLAVAILAITAIQAQENKTVKEESTIKRVVTKEGNDVKVKEVKKTKTEKGTLIVEDNDKTNQEFSEATKKTAIGKFWLKK